MNFDIFLLLLRSLSLSVHLELLSSFPVDGSGATNGLAVAVTLAQASRSLASRCKTAQLTVLHD